MRVTSLATSSHVPEVVKDRAEVRDNVDVEVRDRDEVGVGVLVEV